MNEMGSSANRPLGMAPPGAGPTLQWLDGVPIQAAGSKTEMPEPKNPRRAFDGTPRRILISAYACCPNRGSEPAVGWNWPLELARMGHEVWVITRSSSRRKLRYLDASPQPICTLCSTTRPDPRHGGVSYRSYRVPSTGGSESALTIEIIPCLATQGWSDRSAAP
jgi:hypothetical protein